MKKTAMLNFHFNNERLFAKSRLTGCNKSFIKLLWLCFFFFLTFNTAFSQSNQTEWYVSGLYSSPPGNDNNNGTINAPLASLQKAITLIRENYALKSWDRHIGAVATIIVSGEITDYGENTSRNGMVEICDVYETTRTFILPHIIIRGKDGNDDVINAGGKNRVLYISGCQVTIDGNITIKGGNALNVGGGIYIVDSTVTLNGGNISENIACGAGAGHGGGVFVGRNAKFIMNNGNISNNEAINANSVDYGGGVRISDGGIFIMRGGYINNNLLSGGGFGGGVGIDNGIFVMTGGTISENTVDSYGTGFAYGGGVFVRPDNFTAGNQPMDIGFFIMTGGTIVNNIAQSEKATAVFGKRENIIIINGHIIGTVGDGITDFLSDVIHSRLDEKE
jgi:hypothetical protein